jgi:hypothetical protein
VAMKVFTEPSVLGAADVNEYLVNTKWAFKPSATTRINTTSLANDPDLTLQTDPNKTYWLELIAPFTSIAAAGFKFSFAAPAGSVFTGQFMTSIGPSIGAYEPVAALLITSNIATTSSGGGVTDLITVRGSLVTAGTGGGITYQWAQNTSNGGNTTVRAGSVMYMRRVS